jgi:hypothetical protein
MLILPLKTSALKNPGHAWTLKLVGDEGFDLPLAGPSQHLCKLVCKGWLPCDQQTCWSHPSPSTRGSGFQIPLKLKNPGHAWTLKLVGDEGFDLPLAGPSQHLCKLVCKGWLPCDQQTCWSHPSPSTRGSGFQIPLKLKNPGHAWTLKLVGDEGFEPPTPSV